ncbi:MAG TPA: hypothetical protein PKD53_28140 [Chloroflexaceae bacterium]|nr:hypothetical protein [Chloroflexaceae bacterium]
MTEATDDRIYDLRLRPKDLGVALIAALCLLGGWLLMQRTVERTIAFQSELTPLRLAYPAGWVEVPGAENILLNVADPATPSAFKSFISVENRPIDPASPPTLQTLLDRRVEQRQQLTGYHFLSDGEAEVAGVRALVSDYAYVAQPIDEARRAALPVVVQAREYILLTADQSYYVTMAAPEGQFAEASRQFDRVIASMQVQ